jgi:hypothetical protein
MKFAQVLITNEDGSTFWCGSLHQFCRSNAYGRDFVAEVRESVNQPLPLGGGAAPIFYLSVVA